jgi:hypothetical protein
LTLELSNRLPPRAFDISLEGGLSEEVFKFQQLSPLDQFDLNKAMPKANLLRQMREEINMCTNLKKGPCLL